MPLSEDLQTIAQAAPASEIPNSNDLPSLVGALIKTLEHDGLKVAEELLPKSVADVVDPVAAAVEPAVEAESAAVLSGLVKRAEDALARLEGHAPPAADPTPPPSDVPASESPA